MTDERPPAAGDGKGRYLASKVVSGLTSYPFCHGDTVAELRRHLEWAETPGRYRVFDRQTPTPGIDTELVGDFVVDEAGRAEWKPLRPAR